jgi:hypothetical protein
VTKGWPAESAFRRPAFRSFRATRSARLSRASAMRRRRVLSVSTAARFAKSRHAAANRRYSNFKLMSGRNPLCRDEKHASRIRATSKNLCGSMWARGINMTVREKFSPSLSYLQTAGAGAFKRKRPPSEAASEMLAPPAVVARSIEVPRTMAIGLTDAALDCPTGLAAVPGSTATILVVIAVMATVPVRGRRRRCADCDGADKAQCSSHYG